MALFSTHKDQFFVYKRYNLTRTNLTFSEKSLYRDKTFVKANQTAKNAASTGPNLNTFNISYQDATSPRSVLAAIGFSAGPKFKAAIRNFIPPKTST